LKDLAMKKVWTKPGILFIIFSGFEEKPSIPLTQFKRAHKHFANRLKTSRE
jgi:hypothetical protein